MLREHFTKKIAFSDGVIRNSLICPAVVTNVRFIARRTARRENDPPMAHVGELAFEKLTLIQPRVAPGTQSTVKQRKA
jgi:hypothetical protein